MPNTLEFWKHVPSTFAAIFAIELAYRPPQSKVGTVVWKWRIWLETTVGLSLLEPWEKVLMSEYHSCPPPSRLSLAPLAVVVFIYLLLALTATGILKYLPGNVAMLKGRMSYYLFGPEAREHSSVQRLVAGWVGHNLTREL